MTSQPKKKRAARRLLTSWIALIALTVGSFWIADGRGAPDMPMATWVIGIATLKAHIVASIYMELVHAPRVWLIATSGFLLVQAGLLVALFS